MEVTSIKGYWIPSRFTARVERSEHQHQSLEMIMQDSQDTCTQLGLCRWRFPIDIIGFHLDITFTALNPSSCCIFWGGPFCAAVYSFPAVRFPDALENLTFGILFNQSLAEATLPSNLQRLALGDAFNQSMAQVKLPNTLQYLALGDAFNQSLDSCSSLFYVFELCDL